MLCINQRFYNSYKVYVNVRLQSDQFSRPANQIANEIAGLGITDCLGPNENFSEHSTVNGKRKVPCLKIFSLVEIFNVSKLQYGIFKKTFPFAVLFQNLSPYILHITLKRRNIESILLYYVSVFLNIKHADFSSK